MLSLWSRRISCWFNTDGTLTVRTEATPGEPNVPWMKMGGRVFTFGTDLDSMSLVETTLIRACKREFEP
jgi:hypothetical protein